MGNAASGFAMLLKDKVLLRNVTIAVVASTLGAVAIGTSCLGRNQIAVPDRTAEVPPQPVTTAENSTASAAGGVEPVGTTNITSTTIVVNPAAAPAAAPTSAPEPNQSPVVITQEPAAPPQVRVATPPATPTETAPEAVPMQAPAPTAQAPAAPMAPIIIPIPAPNNTIETPSAGNVPAPVATPGQVQGTQGPTTPGNPYPNSPINNLPQGQLPQPRLPGQVQGVPPPASR
jgi:hypothetical protein